jgi:hypothetical protein
MRQIDSTAYYYHTNAISTIQGQIDAEAHAMLGMSSLLMNEDGLILTNIFTLETLNPGASQPTASESLADTARRLQMEDDISQMNVKIDNIQDDLRNIKTRLGILY